MCHRGLLGIVHSAELVRAAEDSFFVSPGRAKLAALGRLVDQNGLRPVIGAGLPLTVPRAVPEWGRPV
ncbi:hypothetical protein AB0I94_25430 [Streptomyces sp. NPDC050147]|uniref:hypothetical protein n=1 Tax=Streptomyces sp. NPDC050147 TaxID=3155513 RepID=UPI003449427B